MLIALPYAISDEHANNVWGVRTAKDAADAKGPWFVAIHTMNQFAKKVNNIILTEESNHGSQMSIRKFDVANLDTRDYNEEMDCVLSDIERNEEKGKVFEESSKKEIFELRNELSQKLQNLQLHMVHGVYVNVTTMLPYTDLFVRTGVTGEKVERGYNSYQKIFYNKMYFAYFFKVSYYFIVLNFTKYIFINI